MKSEDGKGAESGFSDNDDDESSSSQKRNSPSTSQSRETVCHTGKCRTIVAKKGTVN